jgi:hypothetical protein
VFREPPDESGGGSYAVPRRRTAKSRVGSRGEPRRFTVLTSMPVPTDEQFIKPILRYLATRYDGAPAREVPDAAAGMLHLTDADRAELLPSGLQLVYENRAGWAHDRLKRRGLSSSIRRGWAELLFSPSLLGVATELLGSFQRP